MANDFRPIRQFWIQFQAFPRLLNLSSRAVSIEGLGTFALSVAISSFIRFTRVPDLLPPEFWIQLLFYFSNR